MAPPQETTISPRNRRRATVKFMKRELKRAAKAAALHRANVVAPQVYHQDKSCKDMQPYSASTSQDMLKVCPSAYDYYHALRILQPCDKSCTSCKVQYWTLHLACIGPGGV